MNKSVSIIFPHFYSSIKKTLYNEIFGQNGIITPGQTYNLPSGWTVNDIGGNTGIFDPNFLGVSPCNIPGSSGGALASFTNQTTDQAYFITKPINTIGYSSIKIKWNEIRTDVGLQNPTLDWSINGTNWNPVSIPVISTDFNWHSRSLISLPSNVNNQLNLYLRIGFLNDGSAISLVCFDDILITGVKK